MSEARRADFEKIKSEVGIRAVLAGLRVLDTLKPMKDNDELGGVCPLRAHTGNKREVQFYANTEKNTFCCHGCKGKGNVLDLVMQIGLPDEREKKLTVREAGIWIEDNVMPSGGVEEEPPQSSVASMVEVDMVEVDTELEKIMERLNSALVDLVQHVVARTQK